MPSSNAGGGQGISPNYGQNFGRNLGSNYGQNLGQDSVPPFSSAPLGQTGREGMVAATNASTGARASAGSTADPCPPAPTSYCRFFAEKLDALLDREIPASEACNLLEHAKTCGYCQCRLLHARKTREAVRKCCSHNAPSALRARILGQIRRYSQE